MGYEKQQIEEMSPAYLKQVMLAQFPIDTIADLRSRFRYSVSKVACYREFNFFINNDDKLVYTGDANVIILDHETSWNMHPSSVTWTEFNPMAKIAWADGENHEVYKDIHPEKFRLGTLAHCLILKELRSIYGDDLDAYLIDHPTANDPREEHLGAMNIKVKEIYDFQTYFNLSMDYAAKLGLEKILENHQNLKVLF